MCAAPSGSLETPSGALDPRLEGSLSWHVLFGGPSKSSWQRVRSLLHRSEPATSSWEPARSLTNRHLGRSGRHLELRGLLLRQGLEPPGVVAVEPDSVAELLPPDRLVAHRVLAFEEDHEPVVE